MPDPIIKVEKLGKRYIISHKRDGNYTALRDIITHRTRSLLRKNKIQEPTREEFWALKDVSFQVEPGEVIGVIGRNGAGKSTLLKLLSRITEPTHGRIEISGRVASLLEVGTGFHPELTGRENVFLNGAILGMSRAEIKKKFDEIVDFSGVEKFLDTPVKRYSSGMYVRLAFSVAAHLEPEILVIDEVLAVGDAEFQKKCLGKMNRVSKEDGRTILFVSHDMSAIEQLCHTAITLHKGEIIDHADAEEVVSRYLSQVGNYQRKKFNISQDFILESIDLADAEIYSGDPLGFTIHISNNTKDRPLINDLCLLIYSDKGIRVAIADLREKLDKLQFSLHEIKFTGTLQGLNLVEGNYSIGLYCNINAVGGNILDLVSFRVKTRKNDENKYALYDAQHRGFLEVNVSV
jgi:lipopolysaccharide transport system ATP-binding protein